MFARPPYFEHFLRLLRRNGCSTDDAEDLIQEAFLRLTEYCRENEVRDEAAFLHRTVVNLSISAYRSRCRHPNAGLPVEDLAEILPLVDTAPGPDEVLAVRQRLNEVRKVLAAVSPRTRDIYLAHRAGCTHEELAVSYGVSRSTIEKSIARAVMALMDMKAAK